jgi:hypothetical protein
MEYGRIKDAADEPDARIEVERVADGEFRVLVIEGKSESSHCVTLKDEDFLRLARGKSAEELVRRSFEFLLEREPKESILAEFDLGVIRQYFAEYEREIKRKL